jgi:prephenate dehydrogenase
MTTQITIIGLGQIGASIGLALTKQKDSILRVGHDKESKTARTAKKMGAVDKVSLNLFSAVENADFIVLALPLDQIHETLSLIANDLREDVVIMDTAPVKTAVTGWAEELLPDGRHYVGLTPVINPLYLHENLVGIEAARADLFHRGLMAIVPQRGADSAAVKLAVDLTTLIGATPLFVDPLEVDSFMAATHVLPQLMGAALLNATVGEPGWRDAGKFAGRAYAQVTSPLDFFDSPAAVVAACEKNPENTLRVIDKLIAGLQLLRESIAAEDSELLVDHLETVQQGRDSWWHERLAADFDKEMQDDVDVPGVGQVIGRLLFGQAGDRKKDKK